MEILIRIVDRDAAGLRARGHVIAIQPDGHPWKTEARTNPIWRIIRAPIRQTTADAMMAIPEITTLEPRKLRRYRVDLDTIPNALKFIFTEPRVDEIIVLTRQDIERKMILDDVR